MVWKVAPPDLVGHRNGWWLGDNPEAVSPALDETFQDGGFFTSISSNEMSAAIIWAVGRPTSDPGCDPTKGSCFEFVTLYAFNATPSNGKLPLLWKGLAGGWVNPNANANLVPTVFGGKVYVATNQMLAIFGLSCGGPGQACCTQGSVPACGGGPDLICRNKTCVACGGSGEPCCTGRSPLCTSSNLTCNNSGTCVGCGGFHQPCCTGLLISCSSGSTCVSGTCTPVATCAQGQVPCAPGVCCSSGTECCPAVKSCCGPNTVCCQNRGCIPAADCFQ